MENGRIITKRCNLIAATDDISADIKSRKSKGTDFKLNVIINGTKYVADQDTIRLEFIQNIIESVKGQNILLKDGVLKLTKIRAREFTWEYVSDAFRAKKAED